MTHVFGFNDRQTAVNAGRVGNRYATQPLTQNNRQRRRGVGGGTNNITQQIFRPWELSVTSETDPETEETTYKVTMVDGYLNIAFGRSIVTFEEELSNDIDVYLWVRQDDGFEASVVTQSTDTPEPDPEIDSVYYLIGRVEDLSSPSAETPNWQVTFQGLVDNFVWTPWF